MKSLTFISLLAVLMISCKEKTSDCGDPIPQNCKLILVDMSDNHLLGSTYPESGIELNIANQSIPLSFENGAIIFNYFSLKEYNQLDLKLKLNDDDIDTINLYMRTYSNECWTREILDSLKYNKQIIDFIDVNTFKVVK